MLRQGSCTSKVDGVERTNGGVLGGVETDTGGHYPCMLGHQAHPAPQQCVGDQDAPDFLPHQLWLLAAQYVLALLQRLLDFPKPQVDLPALAVSVSSRHTARTMGQG